MFHPGDKMPPLYYNTLNSLTYPQPPPCNQAPVLGAGDKNEWERGGVSPKPEEACLWAGSAAPL